MDYYWDTIEHCVPPEAILEAMHRAGFEATRRVQGGLLSEYVGTKG
jgi:demethylmenaquinone methyltransferase/2-methoxy-6-polyprenyl-1,4-benzoquinol methylase